MTAGVCRATAAEDAKTCNDESGDVAISACTRAIESGQYKSHDLAILYDNRGVEWSNKNQLLRAAADYAQAIGLDPNYALPHNNRGDDFRIAGDYERALEDVNQAIKLNSKSIKAFKIRADTYYDMGKFDLAIADYNQTIALNPAEATYLLWRYLARAHVSEPAARAELERDARKVKQDEAAYPIVQMFLGQRTPDAIMSSPGASDSPCFANFFVGEWYLAHGDRAKATDAFTFAGSDRCASNDNNLGATARAELKSLQK
jgi:lipoprotein NlpI